jgi:site-specific recombinase XerD
LGVISAEELQKIKSVKGSKGSTIPPGRALSDEDLGSLVAACENDATPAGVRDTAIIGLMFSAGLRRHECALLRLMDYSPQARAVLVRGKGNKEDIVPLEDSGTARALNDWLKLRGRSPGPLFCRVLKGGTIALTSKHLSSETIYSIVKKRAAEAGIEPISPHDARRTLATRLEESGASTHSVQLLLRHSSPSTTERYFRRNDKTKRHAASLISLPYKGRRIKAPAKPQPGPEQLDLLSDTE